MKSYNEDTEEYLVHYKDGDKQEEPLDDMLWELQSQPSSTIRTGSIHSTRLERLQHNTVHPASPLLAEGGAPSAEEGAAPAAPAERGAPRVEFSCTLDPLDAVEQGAPPPEEEEPPAEEESPPAEEEAPQSSAQWPQGLVNHPHSAPVMRLPSLVQEQPDLDDLFLEQEEAESSNREPRILGLYQITRVEILADVDYKFGDLLSTEEEEDLTVDERIKKRLNAYLDQEGEKKCSDDEFQKAKQIDEGSNPCKQNKTPSSAGVSSSPPVQADDASPSPLQDSPASAYFEDAIKMRQGKNGVLCAELIGIWQNWIMSMDRTTARPHASQVEGDNDLSACTLHPKSKSKLIKFEC